MVFASMLRKKELNKITVTELCGVANIDRSTFYSNFEDIPALVNSYAAEIEKQVAAQPYEDGEFAWIFEYILKNKDLFQVYFKLGDIKLNQLQTMDIQRLYNELRENGRIRKEIKDKQPGLSVSYIRGMHNMLKACLNSAVEERLILRNPGLAERNRCQDRIQYAGTQQRRIHPCRLHPCHQQSAGTGSDKDGKPAEAGSLIRKNRHSEPVRTLAWESPKVSGMSGGLPRAYGPRNDSFFL